MFLKTLPYSDDKNVDLIPLTLFRRQLIKRREDFFVDLIPLALFYPPVLMGANSHNLHGY